MADGRAFGALARRPRSLRYPSCVELPDGGTRLFYETSRLDGAHDLRTEYVPPRGRSATRRGPSRSPPRRWRCRRRSSSMSLARSASASSGRCWGVRWMSHWSGRLALRHTWGGMWLPRSAPSERRPEQPGVERGWHVAAHVPGRGLVDQTLLDAEEPADAVEGRAGLVRPVHVPDHVDLLAGEQRVEVPELSAVEAGLQVAPERGPAGLACVWSPRRRRSRKSPIGLQAVGPQVGPVGVGAVHRVAQDRRSAGPRARPRGCARGPRGRRGRTGCSPPAGPRPGRRRTDARSHRAPDPLPVAVGVTGAACRGAARRRGRTSAPSPAT